MKNRWNHIMEAIKMGADDGYLKRKFKLDGVDAAVYRKYAKKMMFNQRGEYVDCVSAETVFAMSEFNRLAELAEMF